MGFDYEDEAKNIITQAVRDEIMALVNCANTD